MSTATISRVTQPRVVRSEWIKLSSLRSTKITLLVSFLLMAGLGVLAAAITVSQWSSMSRADKASFDPVGTVLGGYEFATLAVGILGVLVISNEYSSGMIRATLTAVPRRLPVLWAKAGVFVAVTWVTMTIASFIAFYAGMSVLSGHHLSVGIGSSGVLRAVLGAGLYLAIVGLLGVALGALIRNTAGAIASVIGLLVFVPLLSSLFGSWFHSHISPYLPSNAGSDLMQIHRGTHDLSPWAGFAVMCAWAVAALALAAYSMMRRDA